ncbi:MAG: two-component sensor histidine kinase [Chitinophagia bacterium]|nr:two-component sensor histidine kinase [Chitinophagia bacterium]
MQKLFDKIPLKFAEYAFWILLTYMLAALAWWYIELDQQNDLMLQYKTETLQKSGQYNDNTAALILDEHQRNAKQYIGEGLTFFGLIVLGGIFLYIAVRRQIRYHLQQKNFMMAVTHELKTPIAVTKLSLETLKRHQLDENRKNKIIHEAINETERLDNLCNNILLSSQLDSGGYKFTKSLFNVSELVSNAVESFKRRYPERTFHQDIANDLYCIGEEFLIRLVINNIVGNAIKYTQPDTMIDIICIEQHDIIEILVKDQGEGIPHELKEKIFEKFYRLEDEKTRKNKGTGLGLYLSTKIIKDHGGRIHVRNNHPKGSIFAIQLPKSTMNV